MSIPKTFKQRVIALAVLAAMLLLAILAFDSRLVVRSYTLDADTIASPIRIAFVTDLHSCRYGENQQELIDAVLAQKPDLVLLGGDIFDDEIPDTDGEVFLRGIADKVPCFYVTGNHEYWSGNEGFAAKMDILVEYGVTILSGVCKTLTINGETINLCGVDDPVAFSNVGDPDGFEEQLASAASSAQEDCYTILLSHRPEYFETYAAFDFDLVLSGHAHGGQWRIPLLLNGLYAPNQGVFPQYAGGIYESGATTMVVSRGLARETTFVPRIFNHPELVIVDLR